MKLSRRWMAAAATAAVFLAGCGADASTDDLGLSDAADGQPADSTTVPAVPAEPATMCVELFRAWSAGALPTASRYVTAGVTADLATRPFVPAGFGLAGSATDCFITQYDPATGALIAVGDVGFSTDAGDAPLVSAITWNFAAALPQAVTDRLMRSAPIVFPGGAIPTAVPGGTAAPGSPAPEGATPAGSTADGSTPGSSAPGGAAPGTAGPGATPAPSSNSPTAPGATTPRPVTPTSPGSPTTGVTPATPAPTSPPVTLAPTTTTMAPTLGQASDTALAEDCANAYQPACTELERRYAPASGDNAVATEFVNAVIAGDAEGAGAIATPGLIRYVPALAGGPYPPVDGVDVPGTSFGADGRLQFRVSAQRIVRCYVAAGLVRHCSSAAG